MYIDLEINIAIGTHGQWKTIEKLIRNQYTTFDKESPIELEPSVKFAHVASDVCMHIIQSIVLMWSNGFLLTKGSKG